MRYIAGTSRLGNNYPSSRSPSPDSLQAAENNDWGGELEDRKSTPGFVFGINGGPVFCKSKRQTITALLSGEVEYVAMSMAAQQLCLYRCSFWEVVDCQPWQDSISFPPTTLFVDSTAAKSIAEGRYKKRTKHIDIKLHHIRDMTEQTMITLRQVRSEDQPAELS